MSQPVNVDPEKTSSPFTRKDLFIALVYFLVGFVIYIRTLAPDVLFSDSGEFQVISATGGLAHSTGYPIYLAIGKLFTFLPLNSIAYRVDLVSALMGAVACAGVYLTTKALGARRVFAFIAATILLLNPLFWWQSVIAEVYAISAAFFVAFLLCAVVWRKTRDSRWLLWGAFIGGICLGLHHTVILTLPAMVLYLILSKARSKDWGRACLGALIGVVISMSSYFVMASLNPKTSSVDSLKRSATAFGMQSADFDSPVTQVKFIFLATQWKDEVMQFDKDEAMRNADWYQRESGEDFGWPATVLGIIGLVGLFVSKKGRWQDGVLLGISWLVLFLFILTFNPTDLEVDFIPSFLIIAIFAGMGLQWIQELVFREKVANPVMRWGTAGAAFILVFGGAYAIVGGAAGAIVQGKTSFLTGIRRVYPYPVDNPHKPNEYARAIVNGVEPDALIITQWQYLYAFYYVALFDLNKPGIEVVECTPEGTGGHVAQSMQEFIRDSILVRPVYSTQGGPQTPVDLYYQYYFVPVNSASPFHLYRLRPRP